MPEVEHAGARIWYAVRGPAGGPALLLSNSLGTSFDMWGHQLGALISRFRVVLYDIRGHFGAEPPAGPYSLDTLGGDVIAVLNHAGIERAHVVGLSLGGLTAQWLGIHAPERVGRLVLANTGAQLGTAELWNERIETVESSGLAAISAQILARWFSPSFREREPQTVVMFRAMLEGCHPRGYAGCCAAIRDADLRDRITAIAAPTLVIVGAADVATRPALGELLRDRIPGARLVGLDAAHLSNVEQAEAFTDAVISFLL